MRRPPVPRSRTRGCNFMPEHSIALELRFVEKLICRGFMWETRVRHCVTEHVHGLAAVQACLDIENLAVHAVSSIGLSITNDADSPIGFVGSRCRSLLEPFFEKIKADEIDFHAQIDPNFAQRVSEIFELVVRITAGITDHNDSATRSEER